MKVFYSDEPLTKLNLYSPSLFLAGPTPRSKDVKGWRIDALKILESLNYDDQVLVPERRGKILDDYTEQVEWEDEGLKNVWKIVFWIPRKLDTMPALTTNVEFGRFYEDIRTEYGRPNDAEKCKYLDWLYLKYNSRKKIYSDLHSMLSFVVEDITTFI